jgi:catechol 2,3-dioxygenase-like lactoylglutathione lyase family enzyme
MSSSSLIGQLPLAAVWFYCKDVNQTQRFYRDIIGLKPIEDENTPHFDLGTIRLTLLPRDSDGGVQHHHQKSSSSNGGGGGVGEKQPVEAQHLVFLVESSIEAVYRDLIKRGVKMKSKKIVEDETGKTVSFNDPDGHVIYLWQPPRRDSKNFKQVESLVKHYESVSRALADLRQYDDEAKREEEEEEDGRRERE